MVFLFPIRLRGNFSQIKRETNIYINNLQYLFYDGNGWDIMLPVYEISFDETKKVGMNIQDQLYLKEFNAFAHSSYTNFHKVRDVVTYISSNYWKLMEMIVGPCEFQMLNVMGARLKWSFRHRYHAVLSRSDTDAGLF